MSVMGRGLILPLIFLGAIPCGLAILTILIQRRAAYLLIPAGILSFIVAVQVGIAALFPSTLFGVWKGDRYREKLGVGCVRSLPLGPRSDPAAPADLSMGGVAGLRDRASASAIRSKQAMKNLNISLPDVGMPLYSNMPVILPRSSSTRRRRRAVAMVDRWRRIPSGGGGGFGGGGVGGRYTLFSALPAG